MEYFLAQRVPKSRIPVQIDKIGHHAVRVPAVPLFYLTLHAPCRPTWGSGEVMTTTTVTNHTKIASPPLSITNPRGGTAALKVGAHC